MCVYNSDSMYSLVIFRVMGITAGVDWCLLYICVCVSESGQELCSILCDYWVWFLYHNKYSVLPVPTSVGWAFILVFVLSSLN